MDRERWLARMRDSMEAFFRASVAATPSAHAIERDGVWAAVTPITPDRSVFNSVIYEDAGALAAALDDLAAAYADAGVRAWTVWAPEDDFDTRATLESAGHLLDAAPRAMVIELEGSPAPDMDGIDWTVAPDTHPEVGRLNDVAYGIRGAGFEAAMGDGLAGVRSYVARRDGGPAACVSVVDHSGDAGIWAVATAPDARGRGLSKALMRQALHDAAERGCDTSTLQATKLGAPVYKRVGYRDLGALEMWERRDR